jgi:DNA modification methylase
MNYQPEDWERDDSAKGYGVGLKAIREKLEAIPKSDTGNSVMYHADCRELLHLLPPVNAVITDPPYESHMHQAKQNDDRVPRGQKLDFEDIGMLREEIMPALKDMTLGWLLAFCTPEGVAAWRDEIEAAGIRYKRACVWVKPDAAPQFNGQGPSMGAEMIVAAWCGRGVSKWNGGGRRGVFTHPCNPPSRVKGRHPTEKPLSLMRELIALFTNPGDWVLDPFAGSGTTGVACMQLDRRFIGIESNLNYWQTACDRIKVAAHVKTSEPMMFNDLPEQVSPEAA